VLIALVVLGVFAMRRRNQARGIQPNNFPRKERIQSMIGNPTYADISETAGSEVAKDVGYLQMFSVGDSMLSLPRSGGSMSSGSAESEVVYDPRGSASLDVSEEDMEVMFNNDST
jgi:hypothetical protein